MTVTIRYIILLISLYICTISVSSTRLVGQDLNSISGTLPSKSFTESIGSNSRQVWDIKSDNNGIIYFATNEGLYSNSFGIWREHPIPEPTPKLIRSIYIDNDSTTIWTGHTGVIGKFTSTDSGTLNYREVRQDKFGIVWNIERLNNKIYFQTEYSIQIYTPESNSWSKIKRDIRINNLFKYQEHIYCTMRDGTLRYVEGDSLTTLSKTDLLGNSEVRTTISFDDESYHILLNGEIVCYNYRDSIWTLIESPTERLSLFSAIHLEGGKSVLGTIVDGAIVIDSLGKDKGGDNRDSEYLEKINKETGLDDNTVLSMEQDANKQLWFGLDYGVSYVEIDSPFRCLFSGATVYDAIWFNNTLYLATNKGLYKYSRSEHKFILQVGTEGQVWTLKILNNRLYFAHIRGVFSIDSIDPADPIDNSSSSLKLEHSIDGVSSIEIGADDELIILTNTDLFLSYRGDGNKREISPISNTTHTRCLYSERLSGYEYSTFFLQNDKGEATLLKIDKRDRTAEKRSFPSSDIFNVDNSVIIHRDSTLYRPEIEEGDLKLYPIESAPFSNIKYQYIYDITTTKGLHDIALYTDSRLTYYSQLNNGEYIEYDDLFGKFNGTLNTHNSKLKIIDNHILLFSGQSLFSYDLSYRSTQIEQAPILQSIVSEDDSKKIEILYPATKEDRIFSLGINLSFIYGSNSLLYDKVEYSYMLEPIQKEYSNWSSENRINFFNLRNGEYSFLLKTKINGVESQPKRYKLYVNGPWYQKWWGGTSILLLAIIIITLLFKAREAKIAKERAKLMQEQHQEELLKQKTQQTVEFLTRIEQKNSFLQEIRDTLSTMRNEKSQLLVNKIDMESNRETKDFVYFNFLANNQHQFIEKISKIYPKLTQNDLRLIMFIKTNMTSKDIASITHISVASIDKARYRLRKKLNLNHEVSLSKFIKDFN